MNFTLRVKSRGVVPAPTPLDFARDERGWLLVFASPFLLATANPPTAVDAERAFAVMAQDKGQWTAFRATAADEAVMFVPHPENAQAWLADKVDPPASVEWSPSESYVSCDGTVAVNSGPWTRPGGTVGYFTTVWVRQPDGGWKWVYDAGDTLTEPRPAVVEPTVRTASCDRDPPPFVRTPAIGAKRGDGASPDQTLIWGWIAQPDGARAFRVNLWDGTSYKLVLRDEVAAPQ